MVNKKDLIIAVLITFCLTATLFLIIPTRSQIGEYDPWADIDDDGKINMYDIGYSARLFGTEGDPEKNVSVTNWPEPQYRIVELAPVNLSWNNPSNYTYRNTETFYVGGFSRVFIYLQPLLGDSTSPGNFSVDIRVYWVEWRASKSAALGLFEGYLPYGSSQSEPIAIGVVNGKINSVIWPSVSEDSYFSSKGPYMELELRLNATVSSGWIRIPVLAYLRNE